MLVRKSDHDARYTEGVRSRPDGPRYTGGGFARDQMGRERAGRCSRGGGRVVSGVTTSRIATFGVLLLRQKGYDTSADLITRAGGLRRRSRTCGWAPILACTNIFGGLNSRQFHRPGCTGGFLPLVCLSLCSKGPRSYRESVMCVMCAVYLRTR